MVRPIVKYVVVGLVSGAIGVAAGGASVSERLLKYAHREYHRGFELGYDAGGRDKENELKALLLNLFGTADDPLRELNNGAGLPVGEIAPDFNLRGLDGSFHSLARHRGKPVVVNIWESWCAPCKAEMPDMNEFARDYQGKIAVLAITQDEYHGTPTHVHFSDFVEREGLKSIHVLLDPSGGVKDDYRIVSIPTTFILDDSGRIVATNSGMVDFSPRGPVRKTIDDLLTVRIER